jgi:hypothetical protein
MSEPTPIKNSRKFLYQDKIPVELWAVGVQINYNPAARTARVFFNAQAMTLMNGVAIPLPFLNDSLEVNLAEQKTRRFGYGLDPVTGADLSQISIAGLDRIISCAFDTLHNERQLERDALEALRQQAIIDAANLNNFPDANTTNIES